MPFKIDEVDAAILKQLMEDGRKPYRQIAKAVGVSTPTVESRVRRMFETGLIKKIAPVIDVDKVEEGNVAIIALNVDNTRLEEVSAKLSQMPEVRTALLMTGEANLAITVALGGLKELEEFLSSKIAPMQGTSVVRTNMLVRLVKNEQTVVIRPGLGVRLHCDYCGGEIAGEPLTYKVFNRDRYLCCKGCLASYKEKYSGRIQALAKQSLSETPVQKS